MYIHKVVYNHMRFPMGHLRKQSKGRDEHNTTSNSIDRYPERSMQIRPGDTKLDECPKLNQLGEAVEEIQNLHNLRELKCDQPNDPHGGEEHCIYRGAEFATLC